MAKYKSEPKYMVRNGDIRITFDYAGEYETDDAEEIKILDERAPRYVRKIDGGKRPARSEPKPEEETKGKSESKPESTPKNKSGGKSGGRAKSSGK